MPRPLPYIALAVAYVASGMLGLLLAVPPGYATAVFPPAGIAVGAMLIGGRPTLPWTFLGSFLLNIWTAYSLHHRLDLLGVVVAAAIAAASMLQAAVGGLTLRHAIGYPAPLDNARDIARFLSLSPLFCLTSASLSLGSMLLLGAVHKPDLATSWVTWWIGDTLGVLLVLPLLLVAIGAPRPLWRARARSVAVPMLIFFALFVAIFVRVSIWERDQSLLEFRMLSQRLVDRIQARLEEQDVFLHQLARSFSGPWIVSRAEFHRLVANVPQRFPMIQAVEWAPRIDAADRSRFEAAQRIDIAGFAIRERDPQGGEHPAGQRAQYYPVTYIEPLAGNEAAMGFDLASDPDRRATIERAIASGGVSATAPISLVQDRGPDRGMLLMHAIDGGAEGPGIALVVLQMGIFMQALLGGADASLTVGLNDVESGTTLSGSPSFAPSSPVYEQAFGFGGRRFVLRTTPTDAYWAAHPAWQSWAVLVIGVFSSGLLGALLMLATGQTRRSEQLVEERTRDLQLSNQRLIVEVEERKQAEAALHRAQRMKAIGQLTGGIAHDFNNLLMVVSSNAELLGRYVSDERARGRVAAILQAATRGERLTRQLLAFSRRQMLRPETLDLRQVAPEAAEMLARSLRADIAVTIDVADDLRLVAVDRAELELALLNIGVNARDAMPDGGSLRLMARNITLQASQNVGSGLAGDFVAFTIADSGMGMAPEVAAQAFEPFFTTKDVGQGSGLGLSQVYGFAEQSGGTAAISSEPGKGTAVTMYLPVASRLPGTALRAEAEEAQPTGTPPLRVLLVEDNVEVATSTAAMLRELGCEAVEAQDTASALAILDADPDIELVMSDIVMPGAMNGLELIRLLRARRPDLSVVLATGYSQYGREVAAEGFALLEKPYRLDALARALEAAIAATRHIRAL
jgi:signal transduction histidine kinase/CheY-like chemotaxis protein